MAVYPGAVYMPLNSFSDPGMPRTGLVLHVNDGNSPSLYWWIAGRNGMSCHWQVAKSGRVEQYVDTDRAAWAQQAGNADYLSVETEGFPSEPLNQAQLDALAKLYHWLHDTHGFPYQLADAPGERGFGWHGMGGTAWGHTECPGVLRREQRDDVLAEARALDGSVAKEDDDMARFVKLSGTNKVFLVNATGLHPLVNDDEWTFVAKVLGIPKTISATIYSLEGRVYDAVCDRPAGI